MPSPSPPSELKLMVMRGTLPSCADSAGDATQNDCDRPAAGADPRAAELTARRRGIECRHHELRQCSRALSCEDQQGQMQEGSSTSSTVKTKELLIATKMAQVRFKVGLLGETARKLVVLTRDQISVESLRAAVSAKLQRGVATITAEDGDGDEIEIDSDDVLQLLLPGNGAAALKVTAVCGNAVAQPPAHHALVLPISVAVPAAAAPAATAPAAPAVPAAPAAPAAAAPLSQLPPTGTDSAKKKRMGAKARKRAAAQAAGAVGAAQAAQRPAQAVQPPLQPPPAQLQSQPAAAQAEQPPLQRKERAWSFQKVVDPFGLMALPAAAPTAAWPAAVVAVAAAPATEMAVAAAQGWNTGSGGAVQDPYGLLGLMAPAPAPAAPAPAPRAAPQRAPPAASARAAPPAAAATDLADGLTDAIICGRIREREAARVAKEFSKADEIRDWLRARGVEPHTRSCTITSSGRKVFVSAAVNTGRPAVAAALAAPKASAAATTDPLGLLGPRSVTAAAASAAAQAQQQAAAAAAAAASAPLAAVARARANRAEANSHKRPRGPDAIPISTPMSNPDMLAHPFLAQIASFAGASSATDLHLASTLTNYERKLAHNYAAEHGLRHETQGEGAAKHVVVGFGASNDLLSRANRAKQARTTR